MHDLQDLCCGAAITWGALRDGLHGRGHEVI